MTYDIPLQLAAACHYLAPSFTPRERRSGFSDEAAKLARGKGDYMDLLGSLTVFSILAEAGCVCRIELTAGSGDSSDLAIRYRGEWTTINVKTSSYAPFSDKLHLFVKEEELTKKGQDIYLQVFLHLDEEDTAAHIHVPGWLTRSGHSWREFSKALIDLPGTHGHRGIAVPVTRLRPLQSLIQIADQKF